MDRIIDLDAAAAEIDRRRPSWETHGLSVGPTTWRDGHAWPQRIQPQRAEATDPDSVGVRIKAGERGEMEVCLFRGGWADLAVVTYDPPTEIINDAPEFSSPDEFGATLDEAISALLRAIDSRAYAAIRWGIPATASGEFSRSLTCAGSLEQRCDTGATLGSCPPSIDDMRSPRQRP